MKSPNIISLGEVLWDLLPGQELPGGAPLNVAYHLQQLSQQVAVVSRVGTDEYGTRLLEVMAEKHLMTTFIQKDSEHPTGRVYAFVDNNNEMRYDIVNPVAWDYISYDESLDHLLKNGDIQYVIYGSLQARNQVSRQTLEKVLQSGRRKVLDINLREPYYTKETLEWLMANCQILKLNLAELQQISAWYNNTGNEEELISFVAAKFNIDTIIVTMGSRGCIGYIGGQFHYQSGLSVKVVDTIGSGDAFLAGFLACQINNRTPAYSLAYANAIGALVASKAGGCPEYDPKELNKLLNVVSI